MKLDIKKLYLQVIEDILLSKIHPYTYSKIQYYDNNIFKNFIKYLLIIIFNRKNQTLVIKNLIDSDAIENGLIRGSNSFTMIGTKRLLNIKYLINIISDENIEGDLIEAGVWKGGVIIYMRACLVAYSLNKKVFGADSFKGLPPVDDVKYPDDKIYKTILKKGNDQGLMISKEEVIKNLNYFNFNDADTILLDGWFEDSLKDIRINKLSLLRIDGDMYKSTYEALDMLYHKVSEGGYIVIDDYGLGSMSCKKAVDDFRKKNNIDSELIKIDWTGVFWKK